MNESFFVDGFMNAYGSADEIPIQNEHFQRFKKSSNPNAKSQSATGVYKKQKLTFKRNRNP